MRVETIHDATLYLGDCLEILPTLGKVDAVVTDPPYGIDWDTDYTRFSGGVSESSRSRRVTGDAIDFDPEPFLGFDDVVMFGGNHYATKLPVGSWLIWDKRPESKRGKFLSDAEVAWWNHGRGVYLYKQEWDGFNREGERDTKRAHPTQKPIRLMQWCIEKTTGTVLDPFMGSGTTGVACANLGRKFIGIEIEPKYFDIACKRIEDAYKQPRLFDDEPVPVVQPDLLEGA